MVTSRVNPLRAFDSNSRLPYESCFDLDLESNPRRRRAPTATARARRWKKKPKDGVIDGMVTRTISPFELQPIRSLWDQYAPGNFLNNFPSLWDIGPGIVVLVGTVAWADWYFEVLGRHHRD